MIERPDERILIKAVKALNKHLPAERKTLLALLREEKPAVRARDGSLHRIMRGELEELATLVSEDEQRSLRLPIYLELTADYGRGFARVHGVLDCAVVRRVLDTGKGGEADETLFINREDVRRLRRRLPTATEYAFFYTL
ncbi:MAG: DUF61 family protein [Methanomicrobia archaeon]|nr:DUF61 family protein [Methanomicrobia archaeon]